jgi:tetratricopeptide (TPR) repeat protein
MNRKQYLVSSILLSVAGLALIVTNYFFAYIDWLYVFILVAVGYLFIKFKISGPLQMFGTKFSMLVDYDLDVAGALAMCEEAVKNAPTFGILALYQVYYGMSLYYIGRYEDAIKSFNMIDLKRLNAVYHVLIFSFICYASFELGDMETFHSTLERIKNTKDRVGQKYQGFANSYIEILDAIDHMDFALDQYKEVIEKNFTKEDGFISTRLMYNYRMAYYYKKLGDTLEMDKCLAFVIANGKEHHTALRAKEMFQGSVKVEDFVYDMHPKVEEVIESQTPKTAEPGQIESPSDPESKDKK